MASGVVRSRIFLVLAMVALGCLGGGPAATSAHAVATLDEIVEAWRSREQRTRTAKFEWTESETVAAGSMPPPLMGDLPSPGPPEDVTLQRKVALTLDADMLRYEYEGPQWVVNRQQFLPRRYLYVFDTKQGTTYFGDDLREVRRFNPVGFITGPERMGEFNNWRLLAVLLHCRACDPKLVRFDPAAYRVSSKLGAVGERQCVILEPKEQSLRPTSYWVDPERDFAVLRVEQSFEGKPVDKLDVSYKRDRLAGWVPWSWKEVNVADKTCELRYQYSATVTKYEVNSSIPASEFQFNFPPETEVVDTRDGTHYIVRPGDAKRIVTPRERDAGVPYEVLLATESGEGLPGGMAGRGYVLLYMLLGVAVPALLIWVLYRRAKHVAR